MSHGARIDSFTTMERRTNEANHRGIGLAATLERNPS